MSTKGEESYKGPRILSQELTKQQQADREKNANEVEERKLHVCRIVSALILLLHRRGATIIPAKVAPIQGGICMRRLLVCSVLLAAAGTVFAQGGTPASPPETASGTVGGKTVTVTYSSPRVKGREGHVYTKDGLIAKAHGSQYPIWRSGANAATTLKTEGDIMVGDLHVPAGTYTLFVDISDPDNWVLIVNKKTGEWGLAYDASQDLGKVKMQMAKPATMAEELKYTVGDGKVTLAWENKEASVPLTAH